MAADPEPSIWTRARRAAPRPTLSEDAIVRAAIGVADAGGPPALTMQAVAQALGDFTPMSLYRYVYSKDGLVDLMLDAVLAEAAPPFFAADDWRYDVFDLELRTWAALMRHPWFAQLVHTRPPLGPNALRRTEYLLQIFSGLGADLGTAMGYLSLVERLVIGLALQLGEEARAHLDVDIAAPDQARAALAPLRALTEAAGTYPLLAAWAAAPSGPPPRGQLETGLRMLLDGIAARHPSPPRRRPRRRRATH
jgi:AcrR family transcriptional regulator